MSESGNLGGFDTEAKENQKVNSVIPAGEYDVCMVKSEIKHNQEKGTKNLYCEFKVLSGEFQNLVIIHRFNLWHAKPEVAQISKGQLSEFGRAVNVLTINDSSELEMKPVRVKLNVKESEEYGPQNNITKFKPRTTSVANPAAPPLVPVAADDGSSPWG